MSKKKRRWLTEQLGLGNQALFVALVLLVFYDTLSTRWVMIMNPYVHESNSLLVWVWHVFGIPDGTVLFDTARILLFFALFKVSQINNLYVRTFFFGLFPALVSLFIVAVVNNLGYLYPFQ